jgi:hypothetical protein
MGMGDSNEMQAHAPLVIRNVFVLFFFWGPRLKRG